MARSLSTPLRFVALGTHVAVWISSLIVTGIVSWFLKTFSDRGTHIVYHESIATITLGLWTVGMFLPLLKSYKGYLMPLNLVFSYLWLTSFIFAVQDWGQNGRCRYVGPGRGHCGLKKTVAAFSFLAMFFLVVNVFVEGYLLRPASDEAAAPAHEKVRPSVSTVDTGAAPAAAPEAHAANGDDAAV